LEEDAMRANELLLWLSARREGSWQQFRAAVDELHLDEDENVPNRDDGEFPLHQELRLNFEQLAHVEFFARGCEDGWRVVPPTLAAHPTTDGVRAVLCGARSPALRERVLHAASDLDCKAEILNPFGVPDVLRFTANDVATLAELTEQTGLHFQTDAPLAILSHLPPCDPPRRPNSSEFPTGDEWNIHEFDATALAWNATDRRDAQAARTGMFRFRHRFHRPSYFLRWSGATFKLPRAVGLYVLLKRRQDLLSYDASTQTLRVKAICRPPKLLERALVLCSGLPPAYDSAILNYADVPPEIAGHAADLLRQPLR
jgi:hypothetical protein